jgi:hypothetical protein
MANVDVNGTIDIQHQQEQAKVYCPFPKEWYPAGDLCFAGDNSATPDQGASAGGTNSTNAMTLKPWIYLGVSLLVLYLGIRGLEARARLLGALTTMGSGRGLTGYEE